MPTATSVTEYKTIDEFTHRTSFADLDLALLYCHDNNQGSAVNKPCYFSIEELQTLIAAAATTNQDGTISKVTAAGAVTTFIPSSNTDAARGTAYLNALAAMVDGDMIMLGKGYTYTISSNAEVSLANAFIYGNGATIKAAAGFNLSYLLHITADPDSQCFVSDLTLDANGANVTITSGRGESMRLSGDGEVYASNIRAINGPDHSTAAHFYLEGLGTKTLRNCQAIDCGHVSYRLMGAHSRLYGCDSIIYTYSGDYARHCECDSQAATAQIKTIHIFGGLWRNSDTMKVNANFDPSDNGLYKCHEIILDGITMDFETGHEDPTVFPDVPDAFIKFDDCYRVVVNNCTMRHSNVGTPSIPGTYTTAMWDALNFDSVDHAVVTNCTFDGGLKGAGTSEHTKVLEVSGCTFGRNAYLSHAVWNCSHFTKLIWRNNVCYNLRGSAAGGFRCCFENVGSTGDQKIIVEDSHFSTNWADNMGALFRFVQKAGSVAQRNNTFTDAGLATIPSFASVTRLLATAGTGDPKTLFLTRNTIGASRVGLGNHAVYDTIHPVPVKPAAAGGDWFSAYTLNGVEGARIINENGGPGGNGWPMSWVCNAAGQWVAEDWGHLRDVVADADGVTLTSNDSSRIYTNEGATAEANFILPTAVAGYEFTFVCNDASGMKVTAAAGDTIRVGASVTAAAGNAATTTIGAVLRLVSINATEWIAVADVTTWTLT